MRAQKLILIFHPVFLLYSSIIFLAVFLSTNKASAVIFIPSFDIVTNEHTIGGDDNFNFHIMKSDGDNPPTLYSIDDFNIQTLNNIGSHTTSTPVWGLGMFYLTQDEKTGWENPSIVCDNDNPNITVASISNGVKITVIRGPASITCDFTNTASSGSSSILFLPGLEASRLYKQKTILGVSVEDQLWEPNVNGDVEDLYLNTDGTSKNSSIYTRDIIGETNTPAPTGGAGQNIYKSFSNTMDELVIHEKIAEWKSYAYDWRQDAQDIVNNGTKYQDGNVSLISTLQSLVDSSKNGKVTIVAHSNGGLLAKAFLKKLQDDKICKADFPAACRGVID